MPRQNLSKGEKDYDKWFKGLSRKRRDDLRKAGCGPHCEQPVEDSVFPIIDEHPAWTTTDSDGEELCITERFISEGEVRIRLRQVFDVLARYADPKSAAYFAFIRKLLGEQEGPSVAAMGKIFGITMQASMWRARQIRAALGSIAEPANARKKNFTVPRSRQPDKSWYKPRVKRDATDDEK